MTFTPVTLCFLLRDAENGTEVLLGLKRTGFGSGKIVGIGGHVEPGESDAEAVVREVWEEAGVVVLQEHLVHAGVVEFIFPARTEWNMSCRLFTTRRWQSNP
jgi:8-oxo-dGTP diphosphatase